MSFNKEFYNDKKNKLVQKANANLQNFINSAFGMVSEAQDIQERLKEIDQTIAENEKPEKPEKK